MVFWANQIGICNQAIILSKSEAPRCERSQGGSNTRRCPNSILSEPLPPTLRYSEVFGLRRYRAAKAKADPSLGRNRRGSRHKGRPIERGLRSHYLCDISQFAALRTRGEAIAYCTCLCSKRIQQRREGRYNKQTAFGIDLQAQRSYFECLTTTVYCRCQ